MTDLRESIEVDCQIHGLPMRFDGNVWICPKGCCSIAIRLDKVIKKLEEHMLSQMNKQESGYIQTAYSDAIHDMLKSLKGETGT